MPACLLLSVCHLNVMYVYICSFSSLSVCCTSYLLLAVVSRQRLHTAEQSIIRGHYRVNWIDNVGVRESSAVCLLPYQPATEAVGSGNDVCVYTVY